jgi:hypothetical protein
MSPIGDIRKRFQPRTTLIALSLATPKWGANDSVGSLRRERMAVFLIGSPVTTICCRSSGQAALPQEGPWHPDYQAPHALSSTCLGGALGPSPRGYRGVRMA